MEIVVAVVGAVLVAAILWEVFNDLFHPGGSGALSDWLGRHLFNLFKTYPRLLPLAGPTALVSVIGSWVAGLVIGFALIYLPTYPSDFRTSTGTVPRSSPRLSSVTYFSFETLVTLGYGDVVPQGTFARAAATLEALIGFGLLTASVSSIVLIYPALARMRLLARGVSHLVAAQKQTGVSVVDCSSDVVLHSLARDVTHARTDLKHFPIVYYFVSSDANASVAKWIAELEAMAVQATALERPASMRLAGATLDSALHDFAAVLEERFLHTQSRSREQIFRSFARDHLVAD